jgi:hypothetical protein
MLIVRSNWVNWNCLAQSSIATITNYSSKWRALWATFLHFPSMHMPISSTICSLHAWTYGLWLISNSRRWTMSCKCGSSSYSPLDSYLIHNITRLFWNITWGHVSTRQWSYSETLLNWTPSMHEHLLTLNRLWTYTWLCHTNARPPNKDSFPFKISMCIVSQNRTASNSQNSAPLALRHRLCHGMQQDGTIGIIDTWDSPYVCMCGCVCSYVCASFDWTMTGKGNMLRRSWGKRPMLCKNRPLAWLWELWRNQRLWNFMSSSNRSNKRWLLECPS